MTHTNESSSLVKVAPKVGENGTRRFSWTLSVNRRLSPKQPADGESTILFGRRRRLHRWHMTNPQQACRVWERTDERAGHGLFFPSFERTRITNGSNLLLLDVIAPRWRAAQRDSAFPTQAPGSDKKTQAPATENETKCCVDEAMFKIFNNYKNISFTCKTFYTNMSASEMNRSNFWIRNIKHVLNTLINFSTARAPVTTLACSKFLLLRVTINVFYVSFLLSFFANYSKQKLNKGKCLIMLMDMRVTPVCDWDIEGKLVQRCWDKNNQEY